MLLAKKPQPIKCVRVDYGFMFLHNKARVTYLCMHKITSRSFLAKQYYFRKWKCSGFFRTLYYLLGHKMRSAAYVPNSSAAHLCHLISAKNLQTAVFGQWRILLVTVNASLHPT